MRTSTVLVIVAFFFLSLWLLFAPMIERALMAKAQSVGEHRAGKAILTPELEDKMRREGKIP